MLFFGYNTSPQFHFSTLLGLSPSGLECCQSEEKHGVSQQYAPAELQLLQIVVLEAERGLHEYRKVSSWNKVCEYPEIGRNYCDRVKDWRQDGEHRRYKGGHRERAPAL